jgi:hypothetical protein
LFPSFFVLGLSPFRNALVKVPPIQKEKNLAQKERIR